MTQKNVAAAHEVLTGPAGLFFFSTIAILAIAVLVRVIGLGW